MAAIIGLVGSIAIIYLFYVLPIKGAREAAIRNDELRRKAYYGTKETSPPADEYRGGGVA